MVFIHKIKEYIAHFSVLNRGAFNASREDFESWDILNHKTIERLENGKDIDLYNWLHYIRGCFKFLEYKTFRETLILFLLKTGASILGVSQEEFATKPCKECLELVIDSIHEKYGKEGVKNPPKVKVKKKKSARSLR